MLAQENPLSSPPLTPASFPHSLWLCPQPLEPSAGQQGFPEASLARAWTGRSPPPQDSNWLLCEILSGPSNQMVLSFLSQERPALPLPGRDHVCKLHLPFPPAVCP